MNHSPFPIFHFPFILLLLFLTSCSVPHPETVVAKQYEDAGEYQKAIDVYQRLLKNPPQKTPNNTDITYLYYLRIGDNYLDLDKPNFAEEYYIKAKDLGASTEFIVDRIRLLSRYYSMQGDYDRAIEILNRYRDVSPEDIDYSIDKLHKEQVEQLKGRL